MTYGYIYCLANKAMPGLLKIGYTNRNTSIRVQELSYGGGGTVATGVPMPFHIVKDWRIPSHLTFSVEQKIHSELAAFRVPHHGGVKQKEFFSIDECEAISKIEFFLFEMGLISDFKTAESLREIQKSKEVTSAAQRANESWKSNILKLHNDRIDKYFFSKIAELKASKEQSTATIAIVAFIVLSIIYASNAKNSEFLGFIFIAILSFGYYKIFKDIHEKDSDKIRLSNEYKNLKRKNFEHLLTRQLHSIEIDCPNSSCVKVIIFKLNDNNKCAKIRCPACSSIFKWELPEMAD